MWCCRSEKRKRMLMSRSGKNTQVFVCVFFFCYKNELYIKGKGIFVCKAWKNLCSNEKYFPVKSYKVVSKTVILLRVTFKSRMLRNMLMDIVKNEMKLSFWKKILWLIIKTSLILKPICDGASFFSEIQSKFNVNLSSSHSSR